MARKKKTNKNLVIILLVVLLLALAVGYAAFSETLTITGTANAKGSFDLEFQNADVVTAIGVNTENTKAVISADKNTLLVTVADLAYPGSGAEFTTDIVNVGSIPATVKAVTPFDLEGSENLKSAIKIKGLDAITSNHPTLESGEKCNIHFTVEWDKESGIELNESDGTLKFGLAIEYTQKTDGVTENPPVTDPETPPVTKEDPTYTLPTGLTATAGQKLSDIELPKGFTWNTPETIVTEGTHTFKVTYTPDDTDKYNTLTNLEVTIEVAAQVIEPAETEVKLADLATLTTEDIGKTIDYSVTVTGNDGNEYTYNDWKVLNVDENNVQIIMSDYLPQTGVPQAVLDAGLKKSNSAGSTTYGVYGSTRDELVNVLNATTSWADFAKGTGTNGTSINGVTATGAPTSDMIVASYNAKYGTSVTVSTNTYFYKNNNSLEGVDPLYVPHTSPVSGCYNYWLASANPGWNQTNSMYCVNYKGNIGNNNYFDSLCAVRPVVNLPKS